jgi:hypothetical protein
MKKYNQPVQDKLENARELQGLQADISTAASGPVSSLT